MRFQLKIKFKQKNYKKGNTGLKKRKSFWETKNSLPERRLNAWGINENSPNLVMAIREHLGSARIDTQHGHVIIRQSKSMKNSQTFRYDSWWATF